MGAIASQITSLTIVYSIVYSDADQRKHQSSASLAFVRGIHRGPVNSPHKWPVTRKMFPFDDVIMCRCHWQKCSIIAKCIYHDDVIKCKNVSRYWPFVRGIRRSPVNSPHKGQWRGALMFSLTCAWTNGWTNNRDAGDLRRHRALMALLKWHRILSLFHIEMPNCIYFAKIVAQLEVVLILSYKLFLDGSVWEW